MLLLIKAFVFLSLLKHVKIIYVIISFSHWVNFKKTKEKTIYNGFNMKVFYNVH